jgi:nitronate monooxygenase
VAFIAQGAQMKTNRESNLYTALTHDAHIRVPLICGPMYPCSNVKLVAAVSEAGGLGVVQPVSLTFVEGLEFRQGLQHIAALTKKPIAMNVLIETSSARYHKKMCQWVDIALEEGVRFFITSLGKPDWVVRQVNEVGGIVYHDATNRQWAQKAVDVGVQGLIAVNHAAGGHLGDQSKDVLFESLEDLGLPIICAGGIGNTKDYIEAMQLGYAGCQLGTRFIATNECAASDAYKQAIIAADAEQIVSSERLTGVPVAVIQTDYINNKGLKVGGFSRWMLNGKKRKHWVRLFYTLKSVFQLRHALQDQKKSKNLWQAGKSVAGITKIKTAADIVNTFEKALRVNLSCQQNLIQRK